MGASLDTRTFKDSLGREQIETFWASLVESSLYENGHSYSGCIGMLGTKIAAWNDLNLADSNAANDYISDHQEKWRPAIAVSFQHQGEKYWLIGGWCSS